MFTRKTHLEIADLIRALCFGDKRKRNTVKSELVLLIKMHNLNYYDFAKKILNEDLKSDLDFLLLHSAFCCERKFLSGKEVRKI